MWGRPGTEASALCGENLEPRLAHCLGCAAGSYNFYSGVHQELIIKFNRP